MDGAGNSEAPTLAGRYELGALLGHGGMGTGRGAVDRRLGRSVAGKILRAELVATPGYLAPERLVGEAASQRSDLYSVGVLLYEALSGRRPFERDTPLAVMRAIERGEAEPLISLRPALSPDVVAVVERAMSVDPNDRSTPQSRWPPRSSRLPISSPLPIPTPRCRWSLRTPRKP